MGKVYRLLFILTSLITARGFSLTSKKKEISSHSKSFHVFRSRQVSFGSRLAVSSSAAEKSDGPLSRKTAVLNSNKSVIISALLVLIAAVVTGKWKVIPPTLRFNVISGTVIFSVGDYGAQLLEYFMANRQSKLTAVNGYRPEPTSFRLDADRFVISVVLGAIWAGMCNPLVYATVERILPGGGSVSRILLKMAMTCSILSTIGNYFTMMFRRVGKKLIQKRGIKELQLASTFQSSMKSCNDDFGEVLRDDLKVWPLYDILCYSVIPPKIRPVTTALMATLWSAYMSIASAKESISKDSSAGNSKQDAASARHSAKVHEQCQ